MATWSVIFTGAKLLTDLCCKIVESLQGFYYFTDELCVLQDRTMKTVIGAGEECGGVYMFRGVIGTKIHKVVSLDSWEL